MTDTWTIQRNVFAELRKAWREIDELKAVIEELRDPEAWRDCHEIPENKDRLIEVLVRAYCEGDDEFYDSVLSKRITPNAMIGWRYPRPEVTQ